MNITQLVGENLKIARETKELTQTQLAKELNKFQSDYSNYETGKVQLDYEKIIYLCKRLDITPNDLFGFSWIHFFSNKRPARPRLRSGGVFLFAY